jgi:hypothetical protein
MKVVDGDGCVAELLTMRYLYDCVPMRVDRRTPRGGGNGRGLRLGLVQLVLKLQMGCKVRLQLSPVGLGSWLWAICNREDIRHRIQSRDSRLET